MLFAPNEAVLGLERDEESFFCGRYFPSGNDVRLFPLNSETGIEGDKKKEQCACASVRACARVRTHACKSRNFSASY